MKRVARNRITCVMASVAIIVIISLNGCAQNELRMISIDHMEDAMYWGTYNDSNSSIEKASVPAYENNGIRVSYNLTRNGYVGIFRSIYPSKLSGVAEIAYHCRGGGAPNSIEFKVKDKDGYTFVYICNNATVSDDWKYIKASEKDFKCWWDANNHPCEDRQVNLSEIVEIGFAISNKDGDTPGEGYIYIDEIEGFVVEPPPPENGYPWKIIIIISLFFVLSLAIVLFLHITKGINAVIVAAIITAIAYLLIAFLGLLPK